MSSIKHIGNGTNKHTTVLCTDEKGAGGACHKYEVISTSLFNNLYQLKGNPFENDLKTSINFQNGAVKENGVNGCHNEDLIVIVIDRLQGFQSGEFACRENALAITKLEEALHWLRHRTSDRESRGVEGTSVK